MKIVSCNDCDGAQIQDALVEPLKDELAMPLAVEWMKGGFQGCVM
jgi:hypothetical protein